MRGAQGGQRAFQACIDGFDSHAPLHAFLSGETHAFVMRVVEFNSRRKLQEHEDPQRRVGESPEAHFGTFGSICTGSDYGNAEGC